MAAPTTTDELLDLIRRSEMFDPERLQASVSWALLEGGAEGPEALAASLVRAGLLTQFHAEQFLQGKYRGFTIDKYKVMERIGFGGMGIVYLCEHKVMRHKVAIKVLPTSKNDNPAALGRFYREARAAGALDHPNLVRARDIGKEGDLHFLVMDYIDGASLHQIVHRTGPMAPSRAAHYIGQAALGLEHAREAGLVHRDIKPANILVDRAGTARILDLGLARFYDDETDLLTLKYDENNVLGTADYVAPEQAINSHEVDTRADIYSLGATFYFLLTGQPPFPEGKATQKLIWHQTRQPQAVRSLRPDVPEELAEIVVRMMAKDPNKRYQTPGEVAGALEPWLRDAAPGLSEDELTELCPAAARNATQPEAKLGPVSPVPQSQARVAAAARASAPPKGRPAPRAPFAMDRSRHRPTVGAAVPTPAVLASADGADTDKATAPPRPPRPPAPPRTAGRGANLWTPAQDAAAAVPVALPAEPSLINLALRLGLLLVLGILAAAGARWAAARLPRPAWTANSPSTSALAFWGSPGSKRAIRHSAGRPGILANSATAPAFSTGSQ